MARTKGSDELYKLIHSLTTEEKGYFKKFAQRHTASGNQYLQLFDIISKQQTFEESELKNKFKSYARMKVYLKDLITDAMLMHYRNNHPHIHLLNQIQKIHLLLVKGLFHESLRLIEKALDTSHKIELFTLTRYLERIKRDLQTQTFNQKNDMQQLVKKYQSSMDENLRQEMNLTELELLSMEWFAKSRGVRKTTLKEIKNAENRSERLAVYSIRAEIKKAEVLNWINILKNEDLNLHKQTEKRMLLSLEFRQKYDSSFYTISALDNHILSCINLYKFDEAEELCNRLILAEGNVKLYYNLAFVWGNLRKWMLCIVSGKFEKGLKELNKTNAAIFDLLQTNQESPGMRAVRAYYMLQATVLFCNQKYLESWMCLNESLHLLRQNTHNMPDVLMLQMMIQLELGNYMLLKNMAKQSAIKLSKQDNHDYTFQLLIDFFKKASASNSRSLAATSLLEFESYRKKTGRSAEELFSILPYTSWLESKTTNVSLAVILKKRIAKK